MHRVFLLFFLFGPSFNLPRTWGLQKITRLDWISDFTSRGLVAGSWGLSLWIDLGKNNGFVFTLFFLSSPSLSYSRLGRVGVLAKSEQSREEIFFP
jgi:hypothetical protein